MAICLIVSNISRGQRSERSDHSEVDYKLLKMQFSAVYTIEVECVLNGLHWQRYAHSECF